MGFRKSLAGIPVVFLVAALASPALAASGATCPTSTFASSAKAAPALRVVSLEAIGIPCARAATVVSPLIKDIAAGKGVSFSGAAGISMTQTIVNGSTTTRVKLSYRNGSQISVAMKGRVKPMPGNVTIPDFPAFPNFPTIPSPGSSSNTVV
jgi:hypothetical protein